MKMHATVNGQELAVIDIMDTAMLTGTRWESYVGNVYFLEGGLEVFQAEIEHLEFK